MKKHMGNFVLTKGEIEAICEQGGDFGDVLRQRAVKLNMATDHETLKEIAKMSVKTVYEMIKS